MAEIIDVRIENDHTDEFIDAMHEAVERALETAGIEAEGYAKEYLGASPTRIDTGRLRNSITHSTAKKPANMPYTWDKGSHSKRPAGSGVTKSNGGEEDASVYIGTNVEYAAYVEMGTTKMVANHFLRNALANHKNEYKEIIESELKR